MLAFEVKLNGERICVAGMKDLAILNAGVTAAGPLGEKTVKVRPDEDREIFYSVSGLTDDVIPTPMSMSAGDQSNIFRWVTFCRSRSSRRIRLIDLDRERGGNAILLCRSLERQPSKTSSLLSLGSEPGYTPRCDRRASNSSQVTGR